MGVWVRLKLSHVLYRLFIWRGQRKIFPAETEAVGIKNARTELKYKQNDIKGRNGIGWIKWKNGRQADKNVCSSLQSIYSWIVPKTYARMHNCSSVRIQALINRISTHFIDKYRSLLDRSVFLLWQIYFIAVLAVIPILFILCYILLAIHLSVCGNGSRISHTYDHIFHFCCSLFLSQSNK